MFTDGPDGAPVTGVAQSWEVSPDGLVWTFHLRPEVWSDGQPVTADDFVFAYRHMLDPKTGSTYAYLLYLLKNGQAVNNGQAPPEALGAKALDHQTLQLTLEHPASYLPQLLKHQSLLPDPRARRAALGRQVGDARQAGRQRRLPAEGMAARRLRPAREEPALRGAASVCFDRVDFYPINDAVAGERRALRGELDINAGIQPSRVARLRANPNSARYVRVHSYLSTAYLIFNRRDVAALRDVRVRQAISMAIDRHFLTDKVLRAGRDPHDVVRAARHRRLPAAGRGAPEARTGPTGTLARRQAEARRLLAAAGFGPGHPLKLQMKTFNSPTSLDSCSRCSRT